MKKYAIPCTAEEASNVSNALKLVGFFGAHHPDGECFIDVNVATNGEAHWSSMVAGGVTYLMGVGAEFLLPSYVLAHASELDGAKKPWEIAPEGYRLVTEEEIENNDRPKNTKYCAGRGCEWITGVSDEWNSGAHAVPLSFTFAPPVARMTHAEICKALGKNIEIIKESE